MTAEKLGSRRTPQRDAIFDAIRQSPGPMTIDQLLVRARKSQKNIGVATVYRTVKLLLESSRIQQVVLPDGQTRYEAADLGHHHHFRCRTCDRVYDLPGCVLPKPQNLPLPDGFDVEDHEITLVGTCPLCHRYRRRKNSA